MHNIRTKHTDYNNKYSITRTVQQVYQLHSKGANLILKLQTPGFPRFFLALIPGTGIFHLQEKPDVVISKVGNPGYLAAFCARNSSNTA